MQPKFRPMLACDANLDKIRLPRYGQPKIDGVRALNHAGDYPARLTGRTLKPFANRRLTSDLSDPILTGLDFELCYGGLTDVRLCNATTSATNTIEGPGIDDPKWQMVVYDDFSIGHRPYAERLCRLTERVSALHDFYTYPVVVIPTVVLRTIEEIDAHEAAWVGEGYEGMILRDPNSLYRYGRCTALSGELLRIKRFTDAEAEIISIEEAMENQNAAKTNALGLTERSSHRENMIGKRMIGTFICRDLKTNQIVRVGPGTMTHKQRRDGWLARWTLTGKIIKYKNFPKGVKDKPRFPTFLSFRSEADMPSLGDDDEV